MFIKCGSTEGMDMSRWASGFDTCKGGARIE